MAIAALLNAATPEFRVPVITYPAQIRDGVSILPGGRVLKPYGRTVFTGNAPFAISVSPSGRTIATANIGISPATGISRPSVTLILPAKGDNAWNLSEVVADAKAAGAKNWQGLSAGIVMTSDSTAWVPEGETGRIVELNVTTGTKRSAVGVIDNEVGAAFTGPLAYDGSRALFTVVDILTGRLVIGDAKRGSVIGKVKVGGLPVALALSSDGKQAYVASAASRSVVLIDLSEPGSPKIRFDVQLPGTPSGIAVSGESVFVALQDSDAVAVVNTATGKIDAEIPLRIPGLEDLRGIVPLGLAYEPKSKRLLVAEAGINAVAVIDPGERRVLGHIPTGWFPTSVAVRNGEIYVAAARGTGTGPSSPAHRIRLYGPGKTETAEMDTAALRRGCVNAFTMPSDPDLEKLTDVVFQANGFRPAREASATRQLPPVKYVVVVDQGNRSFDEVLGDVQRAGDQPVLGDPSYARYGMDGYAPGRKQRFSLHVPVTPNLHRMAERWVLADNYYADSDFVDAGRRWLTGAIPNLFGAMFDYFHEGEVQPPFDAPGDGPLLAHLQRHGVEAAKFTNDELLARIKQGSGLPRFMLIRCSEPQGEDFAYVASRVASHDLAIGQLIEALSKTPQWKEMAVFIAGTGAEAGADHIDSHRTVLIGAGPWLRTNYVSHTNASAPALLRTIFALFKVPPMNLFDATAGDLLDLFGVVPEFAPYEAVAEDPRLF